VKRRAGCSKRLLVGFGKLSKAIVVVVVVVVVPLELRIPCRRGTGSIARRLARVLRAAT